MHCSTCVAACARLHDVAVAHAVLSLVCCASAQELCEGLAQAQQQLQDVQADKAKQLEEQVRA